MADRRIKLAPRELAQGGVVQIPLRPLVAVVGPESSGGPRAAVAALHTVICFIPSENPNADLVSERARVNAFQTTPTKSTHIHGASLLLRSSAVCVDTMGQIRVSESC